MSNINLFCFPYAGGSALLYKKYSPFVRKSINIVPAELPGRGPRQNEKLLNSIEESVEDLYNNLIDQLRSGKYAFWGHSMGGVIAFELMQKLKENNEPMPVHFFCSASPAPDKQLFKGIYKLPDNEFFEEVKKYNGTPVNFFSEPQLVKLFLPVLRSDFQKIEDYVYKPHQKTLDIDFTVMAGSTDSIEYDRITAWKNHTQASCDFIHFDGGHFFINDYVKDISELLVKRLEKA